MQDGKGTASGEMRQKPKDNDAESFHVKLTCDELNFPLLP
jgi:hypothetical protein